MAVWYELASFFRAWSTTHVIAGQHMQEYMSWITQIEP